LFLAFISAAIVFSVTYARSLQYLSDDAFVSFRYARNFINGSGLVYNVGEKVEGYTNFLWTMLIALGMKMQIDPETFAGSLGIFFSSLTILLFGLLSWKHQCGAGGQFLFIPLTSLALALHTDFNAHATSGLETAFFTFLVSAAFGAVLSARSQLAYIWAGMLFVILMMTRPDGVIFLGVTIIYIFITNNNPTKKIFILAIPTVCFFLPYWLWRWQYYGLFFPNTFYAKSVSLSYYSQGIMFAVLYFKTYYVFMLPLALGMYALWKCHKGSGIYHALLESRREGSGRHRPVLLGTLFIIFYSFYIVRLGGDFMFARFFIPITPVMYFVTEALICRVKGTTARLTLSAVVLVATFARSDQYMGQSFVGFIADEKRYFTVDEPLERSKADAATLRNYFLGLPVRVGFWAGQLRLIYYVDPLLAVECSTGLTDTAVAHQSISARGRPGHEKNATLSYLMQRKVNFYLGPTDPPPPGELVLNLITFQEFQARIIIYENAVMEKLAAYPEVKFVRMPAYLDSYIREMKNYPREKIEQDYQFFKSYYFDHNADTLRRGAILAFLKNETPLGEGK